MSSFFEGGDEGNVDPIDEFEDASMPTDSMAQQSTDPSSRSR